jgi:uncharacterized protein (UPF0276 family)
MTYYGVGVGYRRPLEDVVLEQGAVDWVEVISEHFMADLGKPESGQVLKERLGNLPVVPHGVEMSIGTPGDEGRWDRYVSELVKVVELFDSPWCSDHLCFTRSAAGELATLTPLPRTWEAVDRVARRARIVTERTGVPFLLENISYHMSWGDELTEAEFLSEVLVKSGCYLLLDLTNLHYNAVNHGFSAEEFLTSIPLDRVRQVHLAGGTDHGGVMMDTHSETVPEEVWSLLKLLGQHTPVPAVMLERDQRLDKHDEIRGDLRRIRAFFDDRNASS